ncbi:MAG: nucleotide exchange factor GrpE [Clostridia bacterium]|nr:nucleotide exchange factor GrpE [Clostridia bacterium]
MNKNKQKHNEEEILEFKPEPEETVEEQEVELEKVDEKYEALNSQYIRLQADFENFKKRNASTASYMYANGVNDFAVEILPMIDYLDMAINAQKDEEQRKGIEMAKNAFLAVLGKFGVNEMSPLDEVFDPNKHEAVMKVEDSERSGKIVEVVKVGYQRDGKILRHPMVVVAE